MNQLLLTLDFDTPEQAEIRQLLNSLPACNVVGRGECDCAACRFAWPEEYEHLALPRCERCGKLDCERPGECSDGIVRGPRPKRWQANQARAAETRARVLAAPAPQPAWCIY